MSCSRPRAETTTIGRAHPRPEPSHDLEPVEVGQAEVEEDGVRRARGRLEQGVASVRHREHAVAGLAGARTRADGSWRARPRPPARAGRRRSRGAPPVSGSSTGRAGGSPSSGIVNRKAEPPSGRASTQMRPPCTVTIPRQMARPSPRPWLPPTRPVRWRSNTASRWSAGIARPAVEHLHEDVVGVEPRRAHLDGRRGRRVPARVVEQVDEHLLHEQGVDRHERQPGLEVDGHVAAHERLLHPTDREPHDVLEGLPLLHRTDRLGVEPRHRDEVAHEPVEAVGLAFRLAREARPAPRAAGRPPGRRGGSSRRRSPTAASAGRARRCSRARSAGARCGSRPPCAAPAPTRRTRSMASDVTSPIASPSSRPSGGHGWPVRALDDERAAQARAVADGDAEARSAEASAVDRRRGATAADDRVGRSTASAARRAGARASPQAIHAGVRRPLEDEERPAPERTGRLRRRQGPEVREMVRARQRPRDLPQRLRVPRPPLRRLGGDPQAGAQRAHHERHEEERRHRQDVADVGREPEDGRDEEVGVARGRDERAEQRRSPPEPRPGEEDRDAGRRARRSPRGRSAPPGRRRRSPPRPPRTPRRRSARPSRARRRLRASRARRCGRAGALHGLASGDRRTAQRAGLEPRTATPRRRGRSHRAHDRAGGHQRRVRNRPGSGSRALRVRLRPRQGSISNLDAPLTRSWGTLPP